MQESTQRKDVYVTLDSLFDTRFTILSIFDKELATRQMDENYLMRTKDEFEYMSTTFFKLLYEDRIDMVLKMSKMTHIIKLVAQYISEAHVLDVKTGGDGIINLYVNIYPYEFDDDTLAKIKLALLPYLNNVNDIRLMRNDNVKPDWIYRNIGTMIDYDILEWVNRNVAEGTLQMENMLELLLVGPKLYNNPEAKMDDEGFSMLEKDIKPVANLSFIDTFHFSIAL